MKNRGRSRHHLLFPRSQWNTHEPLRYLRGWLIVDLFTEDHDKLHSLIGYVPPLPINEAYNVWHKVKAVSNKGIELRLWVVIMAIEEEAEKAGNYYVKRSLLLTAEALNAQLSLITGYDHP